MPVEIIDTLARKNSANFPLVKAEDALGAFVTVPDIAARDAIVTGALRQGQIVRIGASANYYEWDGAAWDLVSFGGSSGHTIEDEGIALTPRSSLNFVGVNVTVTDAGGKTVVTVGAVNLASGVTGVLPVANGGTGLSAAGTNGQVLTIVSGVPAWATPGGGSLTAPANPGDDGKVAIAASGNFSYAFIANANVASNAAIALSKLADGSACSVVGRSANSSGAHADIASSADGEVFRRAAGALGWGTIATAGIGDSQVTLPKLANGTAVSLVGRAANSSGVYADIQAGTNGFVFLRRSNALTAALLLDENIDASAAIALSKLASQAALSVVANATNATAVPTAVTAGTDGHVLRRSGTSLAFGQVVTAGIADANVTDAKLASTFLKANGTVALSASWDVGNQAIDDVKSISYEQEVDNGNSGTADTIDWTTGSQQKSTLTGNCTYTFTAPQPHTYVQLRTAQDATGGRTVTLPVACVSLDGIVWQPNPTASSTSFLTLYYDGTSYYYYGRSPDARVITESTTARSFALADAGAFIENTSGSAVSYTVEPNSTTAFPIGTEITGVQAGAGQLTFVQGSGVTINKPASRNRKTAETFSTWALKKTGTNTWYLFGDLEFA